MEDAVTCSLCMEVFTDPVSLPCGHGFCRGCLRALFGQNSRVKTEEDTSSDSALLPCPLCRSELTLGPRGVDELQPNQTLCEVMSKYSDTGPGVTALLCDMCEGEKKPADSYCTNCMTLYCTECLSTLHPRRGPFGRHRLMAMEDYTSEKSSPKTVIKTSLCEDDADVMYCKEHREPLSLFCGTCERPICTICVPQHDDHVMLGVSTAFARNKDPFEKQANIVRAIKLELQKLQTDLIFAQKDVQTKTDDELKDIEQNYESCLKTLQDWRKSERDKVENKRDTLASETLSLLKTTNLLIEETDRLLSSSAELLSRNEAVFLQESKELASRLQCHSTESSQELGVNRQKLTEIRTALSRWDLLRCVVTIPENSGGNKGQGDANSCAVDRHLEVPKLKFTASNDADEIIISQSGHEVVALDGYPKGTWVCTDGRLTKGLLYWEVELTCDPSSCDDGFCWVGSVGVRHEVYNPIEDLGYDNQSWSVNTIYEHETKTIKHRFVHYADLDSHSYPITFEKNIVTIRLGFFLQMADRTLTVVDVDKDTRLFTFRDLDLSQALVPVVEFGIAGDQRTFRLPRVDVFCLPESVRSLLDM